MNVELKELIDLLKSNNVETVEQGIKLIDGHFESVVFSLMKDEWVNHMTKTQKKTFVRKVLKLKK